MRKDDNGRKGYNRKNYVPDDKREIKHVDAVLKLLSVMTKDNSYSDILYEDDEGKAEVKTMCEVATRLKDKGKQEGRREVYLSLVETKLAKRKTTEQIMDELELSREEVEWMIQFIRDRRDT